VSDRLATHTRPASCQRGARRLAQRDNQLARQRGQRPRHEFGHAHGERAEPHRSCRRLGTGRFARGRVELVQDPGCADEQPRAGRGQADALAPTLEQSPAGDGTLDKLDRRVAERFAAAAADSLHAVDALVAEWRQAVRQRRAEAEGFGSWLNIPSKVAQVAAIRPSRASAAPRTSRTAG
jgi:hypothetical protein